MSWLKLRDSSNSCPPKLLSIRSRPPLKRSHRGHHGLLASYKLITFCILFYVSMISRQGIWASSTDGPPTSFSIRSSPSLKSRSSVNMRKSSDIGNVVIKDSGRDNNTRRRRGSSMMMNFPSIRKRKQESELIPTDFLLRDSRLGFVRKVYLLLSVQLLTSCACCLGAISHRKAVLNFMMKDSRLTTFTAVCALPQLVSPSLIIAGSGITRSNRKSILPKSFFALLSRDSIKLMLLGLMTVGQAGLLSLVTCAFESRTVGLVLAQTGAALLGLTLYAFQTNPEYDLTGFGQSLFSTFTVWFVLGLARAFFFRNMPLYDTLYSAIGASLFALFIIYDTQLVLGGKHRSQDQIHPKDYVLGAAILYTDIIALFLQLLKLFGRENYSKKKD